MRAYDLDFGLPSCVSVSPKRGFALVRRQPENGQKWPNLQIRQFQDVDTVSQNFQVRDFGRPPPVFRKSALPLLSGDLLESPISTLALIKDPQNLLSRPSSRRSMVKIGTFCRSLPVFKAVPGVLADGLINVVPRRMLVDVAAGSVHRRR
jgi:hypothetical protein